MKKGKMNNGITLIALVITIIVLLILAGVTIGMATSGTGLFDKAKEATEKYQNAQNEEQTLIAKYSNEIESYVSGNREDTSKSMIKLLNGSTIDVTTTQADTYVKYSFSNTNIVFSQGDLLTFASGGVKIGKGVHHIRYYASMFALGVENIGFASGIGLLKNKNLVDLECNITSYSSSQTYNISGVIEVAENDVINLGVYCYLTNTIVHSSAHKLTIEVID